MELSRQKTYKKVFDMACADLLCLDLKAQCRNGGIHYEKNGAKAPSLKSPSSTSISALRYRNSPLSAPARALRSTSSQGSSFYITWSMLQAYPFLKNRYPMKISGPEQDITCPCLKKG